MLESIGLGLSRNSTSNAGARSGYPGPIHEGQWPGAGTARPRVLGSPQVEQPGTRRPRPGPLAFMNWPSCLRGVGELKRIPDAQI